MAVQVLVIELDNPYLEDQLDRIAATLNNDERFRNFFLGCRASPKGARLRSSIAFALDGFEKTKYDVGPHNDGGRRCGFFEPKINLSVT